MSHNEHPYRMSRLERHLIGIDHAANKARGDSISQATVTLKDDYNGQDAATAIRSAVTVNGLKVNVLVGDFPKKGRYRLTFLSTIGSEVFQDEIVITVED